MCHTSTARVQLQFLHKIQEAQIIELCKTVLVVVAEHVTKVHGGVEV